MPSRQKRHWARVQQRWADEVQRDMDVEVDTVQGQSQELSPHHPSHYEMVEPPPPLSSGTASTRVGGGKSSTCTIQ